MNLNYNLEILRIIGAFGIVWFHSGQELWGRRIGYSGLIIFVLISIYLLTPKIKEDIHHIIYKKTNRLVLPWICWFFIYGIINISTSKSFLPHYGNILSDILAGPRMHLWYLPFLFIASTTIIYYNYLLKTNKQIITVTLSIILLLTTPLWRPLSLDLGMPWAQWFHAVPAVFIGLSIAYINVNFIYAVIIASISIWLIVIGQYGVGIPYLVGCMLFIFSISLKNYAIKSEIIPKISDSTYGIYLVHPLIYSVENRLGFQENLMLPVVTFLVSLLVIIIIRKIPLVNKII